MGAISRHPQELAFKPTKRTPNAPDVLRMFCAGGRAVSAVFIDGTPFFSVYHHDGRMIRAGGLFAFARLGPDGRHTVLHLELADAINRRAEQGHPRWGWALSQGMNEVLVHLAGAAADLAGADDPRLQAQWHDEALVCMGETTPDEDASRWLAPVDGVAHSRNAGQM